MDEELLSDADLWDLKVSQGMPKSQATAYVRNRSRGAGGTWEPKNGLDRRGVAGELDHIRQGMSLGFSDEAAALLQSIPSLLPGGESPRESLARNLAEERAPMKEYAAAHPTGAVAANLLGAAATGRGLPRLGSALKEGIVYGGAAGVGMAEGGLKERATGGAIGAAVGGLLGPVAARAIPAVAKAGSYLADVVPGVRTRVAPALQTPAAPVGSEVRMTGGSGSNVDPPIATTIDRAVERILQAAQRAGLSADDVAANVSAAGEKPVTVMEAIGQPARRLGRGVNTVPSEGSDVLQGALRSRQAGQEERVIADLVGGTGLQRQSAVETVAQMAARRSAEAAENYAPVYERSVNASVVRRFFDRPAFQRAYQIARDIAADEGESLPALSELDGDIPVRVLDRIKRGMDDMLDVGRRSPLDAGGVGPDRARTIRNLKNEYLSALDEAVPGYSDARSAFAGQTAMMNAMEEGRRLFSVSPDEARMLLADMGESEREAWRKGALDAVAEMIEGVNASHDITARRPLAESTLNRRRLRLLFPDEASWGRFQDAIRTEAEMAATLRFTTGGSNTADKLADLADLAGVDVGAIFDAVSRPAGALAAVANRVAKSGAARRLTGQTEELADALAPQLTAGSSSRVDLDELLRLLRETEARLGRVGTRQQNLRRGTTAASGGLLE